MQGESTPVPIPLHFSTEFISISKIGITTNPMRKSYGQKTKDWKFTFSKQILTLPLPWTNCQALSLSSLFLLLYLLERERADTIITLYHHPPQKTF